MAKVTILEKSRIPFTHSWVDGNGNSITPANSRWRVDCVTTGEECLTWQTGTATAILSATIPASANVIRDTANDTEVKKLTIQGNYDDAVEQVNAEVEYYVSNNQFYT